MFFDSARLTGLLIAAALLALPTTALGADARVQVMDEQQVGLTNVVVIIEPEGVPLAGAQGAVAQIDQIDRQFVPHVQVVQTNTLVNFPNLDDIRHHVFSFSEAKRFELPLYKGTPAEPVLFDRGGIVTLACNIHDWMLGYLYVTDSPWHALTDEQGRAALSVPDAGRYLVRVWHPSLGADHPGIEQVVDASELASMQVTLEQQAAGGGRRQLRRSTRYP